MSRIFASEDIALLVANFSPLSLHEDRPLLSLSTKNDALINLDKATRKLERLLQQNQSRIPKVSLPQILDLEPGNEKLILDRLTKEPIESRDHKHLVPIPETDAIVHDLLERTSRSCPELTAFATEKDIDYQQLERYLQYRERPSWQRLSKAGKVYVYNASVAADINARLRNALEEAATDICEIPASITTEYPVEVVRQLAEDLARKDNGVVRSEGDRLIYIMADHSADTNDRTKQEHLEHIQKLAQSLSGRGFCEIDAHSMDTANEVMAAYFQMEDSKHEIERVNLLADKKTRATPQLLVRKEDLDAALDKIKDTIRTQVDQRWITDERAAKLKLFTQCIQRSEPVLQTDSELCDALLRSEYISIFLTTITEQTDQLSQEENTRFAQLIETRLLVPLHLYSAGLETIKDLTLKQHLEDFLLDHFRNEVLPQTIKAIREQNFLRDPARDKQVKKLQEASSESKSFESFRSSVDKFCKKLSIAPPTPTLLQQSKQQTLQSIIKSLKHLPRSSDLLQNLIWLLLASSSQGLFMSSGKDTSRMIKQYEAVGNAEIAKRLVGWRDLIKAGQESKEDLHAMRDLAVEGMKE